MPHPADFESRYQEHEDPFDVRSSPYERRKLRIVLASLARERYRRAWDAACGTGDLALALTERADEVLATDAAPTAVRLAGELLAPTGAETRVCTLPEAPDGPFDLVVLSEVCYYLDADDRAATYTAAARVAGPDAEVVAVTWRHLPHDGYLSGAEVTGEIEGWFTANGWRVSCSHEDVDFLAVHLVRGRLAPPAPGDTDEPGDLSTGDVQ